MSDSERDFIYRMDARLDDVAERVSKIEGANNKSAHGFRRKLSEYGGTVALLLSITIGIFTVYDKTMVQPEKDRALAMAELRNNVNALSDVTAKTAALDWQGNFMVAQAQAQMWNPQRLALLEKIAELDRQFPGVLMFADRIVLIKQYEYFALFPEAMAQVELAFKSATNPIQTADAYWAHARISAGTNKMEEMRESFTRAREALDILGFENIAFNALQMYTDWVGLELVKGTCESAGDVHEKLSTDFNSPAVWPLAREEIRKQFAALMSSAPRNCGLTLI